MIRLIVFPTDLSVCSENSRISSSNSGHNRTEQVFSTSLSRFFGRPFDNIFIERLWRSVKYEEVYVNDYDSMNMAQRRLRDYFNYYNRERFHQSLDYRTPASERIASAVEIPMRCISTNIRRSNLTRIGRISLLKSRYLLSKGWG